MIDQSFYFPVYLSGTCVLVVFLYLLSLNFGTFVFCVVLFQKWSLYIYVFLYLLYFCILCFCIFLYFIFIFCISKSDHFIPATVQFNSQCRRPASMNILQRLCKSCPTLPQSAWIACLFSYLFYIPVFLDLSRFDPVYFTYFSICVNVSF